MLTGNFQRGAADGAESGMLRKGLAVELCSTGRPKATVPTKGIRTSQNPSFRDRPQEMN